MGTLAVTRKTSNTLITAVGFNTNYDEIEAEVNSLDTTNYAADSVTAAKLNSDVVRADYGLSVHTTGALQVDPSDTNPALEITDGGLRVKVDGTTIKRTASGLAVVTAPVTDHGALSGLTDDDHTAYLNTTRHDADDHSGLTVGESMLSAALGTWATKTDNTVYQAATDGFVVVFAVQLQDSTEVYSRGYTDGSNPPTTQRGYCLVRYYGSASQVHKEASFMMPVKKSDYYKVVKTTVAGSATQTIYFIPLGS